MVTQFFARLKAAAKVKMCLSIITANLNNQRYIHANERTTALGTEKTSLFT